MSGGSTADANIESCRPCYGFVATCGYAITLRWPPPLKTPKSSPALSSIRG